MTDMNESWEALAKNDARHAVSSVKGKRGGWEDDEFLAKGREYVALTRRGWEGATGPVLEVGCGAGRCTGWLALHFDRVVGLDVAPSMIREARRLVTAPNVTFTLGDGETLPDGPWGLIFSTQVFQHVPRKVLPGLFHEMARVLDGRAVVHIPLPTKEQDRDDLKHLVGPRRFLTRLCQRLGLPFNYGARPWIPQDYNRYTAAEVEAMAADAGLKVADRFEFRPGRPQTMTYVFERA